MSEQGSGGQPSGKRTYVPIQEDPVIQAGRSERARTRWPAPQRPLDL